MSTPTEVIFQPLVVVKLDDQGQPASVTIDWFQSVQYVVDADGNFLDDGLPCVQLSSNLMDRLITESKVSNGTVWTAAP